MTSSNFVCYCSKRASLQRGFNYPLRISKEENRKYVINLLLLVGARPGQRLANDEKKHYCLINNISRLLSSQASRVLTQVSVPLLKQRKACTP